MSPLLFEKDIIALQKRRKFPICSFYPNRRCLRGLDVSKTYGKPWKCEGCLYLKIFELEMEAMEDEFFREVDEIRKRGYM